MQNEKCKMKKSFIEFVANLVSIYLLCFEHVDSTRRKWLSKSYDLCDKKFLVEICALEAINQNKKAK